MVYLAPPHVKGMLNPDYSPSDFRALIANLNTNFATFIMPDKEGKKLIKCAATMPGAVALQRHIAKGGFQVGGEEEAPQPAAAAATPVQQQQQQPAAESFPMPEVWGGQPEEKKPVYSAPQPQPSAADASAALAALAALMPKQGVDEEAVRRIVAECIPKQEIDAAAVRSIVDEAIIEFGGLYRGIELKRPDAAAVKIEGKFHRNFPQLLQALSIRQSVYMFGPAGTSKTTSARKAAEALGLPFILEVVGLTSTKTDFLGFVDAGGRCTETNFKRAFLQGGVYFIDEADSANANVGIALNTAIENGICAFPDGVFEAHPDFVAVAAGNTNGKGGTAQFGGRVRMDSAFQDRFAFLEWPIDEAFEKDITTNQQWTAKVQCIRAAVKSLGLDELPVTPRLSVKGERLLAAGFSQEQVLDMLLFRGAVSDEVKNQILSRI
jgi:hypothetical protein